MSINPHIFRAYDIRGIAAPKDDKPVEAKAECRRKSPADLTEETVYLIGRAVALYLQKKYGVKTMAVGCDNRLTSEKLKNAYMQGLIAAGIQPTDIGLVTSPMVYWTTCAVATQSPSESTIPINNVALPFDSATPPTSPNFHASTLPFDSATNITASHNPKEYNGLKIVTKGAHSICGEELQEVLKIIETEEQTWPNFNFENSPAPANSDKTPDFSQVNNSLPGVNPDETPNSSQVKNSPPGVNSDKTPDSSKVNNSAPSTHSTASTDRATLGTQHTPIPTLDIWPQYLADITSRVKPFFQTAEPALPTKTGIFKKPESFEKTPNTMRPLKVVVDCGNGVAGKFAPELLRKLGCEVIELYCDLDGNFPNHEANPEELHNMRDLIKATLDTHADLGMGFDGDGDRIGIIDENGHHYSSDFMLLLLARDLLTRLPGSKIVFDVKVSQAIINDLKKHGAVPVMSKTGHSFIEAKMKEIGAPLAGEVSGHLFFAENYYGFDDALFAAAKILEIAAKNRNQDEVPDQGVSRSQGEVPPISGALKPFSSHFADLPKTCTTPEFKAACPDDRKFTIVSTLVDHFTKLYPCITIDGVRVNFDENSWGAIRASNTSPNLTLRFESTTPERLKEIQEIMVTELKKHPEVNLGWYKE